MKRLVLGGLSLGLLALAAGAGAQGTFVPKEERMEDLPEGPGREETFALCTACHGFKLVSSQGMSRARWDETLTWMTLRHKMPNIQGADRDLILNYLARYYPPRAPLGAGGLRNPFAPE